MSLIRTWTIHCDLRLARDCVDWVGNEDTAKLARQAADDAGWHKAVVDGANQDVCPRCLRAAEEQRQGR